MNHPQSVTLVRRSLNTLLRTRFVSALADPRSVDDYLEMIDPSWSVREVRARIIEVYRESTEAVSLRLQPNDNWRGFRAGQFVRLSVPIAGVRYTRCFSLSSAPEDGPSLRLTINAVTNGRVSGWAKDAVRVGGVVQLTQALGNFVLPDPLPPKILFVSGGSGITPIMSMVRHLVSVGYSGEITCLHYARREVIFRDELVALASRCPGLRLALCLTRVPDATEVARVHFSFEQLEAFAPGWTQSETFLCGPAALADPVAALWRAHGLAPRLHIEHFAVAPSRTAPGDARPNWRLVFAKSKFAADVHGAASLLEQAEAAGLQPSYGCRVGTCFTCKCQKVSGVVRNELTGAISGEPDEEIRLCISTPQSNITLDL